MRCIMKKKLSLLLCLLLLPALLSGCWPLPPKKAKPVVYLYPTQQTDVSVSLTLRDGAFTCTYPTYNNGWDVTAYPDGHLINKADGLEYSYLYWEANSNAKYDLSHGSVVAGGDTADYLRKSLATLGLTPREYNEFIVYWLPKMQENPYNLITFQTTAYTDSARLTVTPQPDTLLRVFMAYRPLEKKIDVPAQELKTTERTGFTVVEWGGTELK